MHTHTHTWIYIAGQGGAGALGWPYDRGVQGRGEIPMHICSWATYICISG